MIMTLGEYIKNPMGKNNAVFSQRDMYKSLYTQKFDALIAREAGKITYRLYKDNDRRYIIHLKIPSEVVAKFYYDVVLEFIANDVTIEAQNTLKNYEVKFFSNDPAFVFTHAYAFNKNNLFIEDLAPKMSKKALADRADIRNPKSIIGYVKSIYFAYLFIELKGLDRKPIWLAEGIPYVKRDLLNFVEEADKKVLDRQLKGEEKEKQDRKRKNTTPQVHNKHSVVNTHSVVKTKTINTGSKVKYTKTTKRK